MTTCRYDDILVNGLPDWRQPVFYYRRVRKMSNAELAFLLFLILTVGHYAVLWSIYLEKQLVGRLDPPSPAGPAPQPSVFPGRDAEQEEEGEEEESELQACRRPQVCGRGQDGQVAPGRPLRSHGLCPPRVLEPPHWHDLLPLKLSVWVYLSVRSLPQSVQVEAPPPAALCGPALICACFRS